MVVGTMIKSCKCYIVWQCKITIIWFFYIGKGVTIRKYASEQIFLHSTAGFQSCLKMTSVVKTVISPAF